MPYYIGDLKRDHNLENYPYNPRGSASKLGRIGVLLGRCATDVLVAEPKYYIAEYALKKFRAQQPPQTPNPRP